ncbi:MAG TPA: ATP-binding protein [Longimicrobiaceae bacterium]|nr:ATP-binding protein [Longimicrobiaceae bacterium]
MSSRPMQPPLTASEIDDAQRRVDLLRRRALEARAEMQTLLDDTLREVQRVLQDLRIKDEILASSREMLDAEQRRYQELFDLAPDAYVVTDRFGAIRQANRAASALFRVPGTELVGQSLAERVHEAERKAFQRQLLRLSRGERIEDWEIRLRGCGEDPVHAAVTVTAADDPHGTHLGHRWLIRDVTERRRAEEAALRLIEEQAHRAHAEAAHRRATFLAEAGQVLAGSLDYGTTLANVARLAVPRVADSCIVYVVEEDGQVRRPGAAHVDPDKEARLHALLRTRPFDSDSPARPVARVLRTGEPEVIPEVAAEPESLALDADELRELRDLAPRSLMVVPLVARGRVLGAISLGWGEAGRCYTPESLPLAQELAGRAALAIDNARLYTAAQQASQAKSEFLSSMSHELRTPLNVALGFADLLLLGVPEAIPASAREHVERIRTASQHLLQLVEQVLTFSRIEALRETVSPAAVDLAAIAGETAALVEPLAREKGLSLTVRVPAGRIVVRSDPAKLRQILLNLLANAVKFTEAGEVVLVAREERERIALEVRDTGRGIPAEHLERIWEPFHRVEEPGEGRPGGTGLGLAIVRRLTHLLGGGVRVESARGQGSTFTVDLPVDCGAP